MALPLIAAGGGAALGMGANLIGMAASAKDRAASIDALRQAVADIDAIGAPPDIARQIILEKFTQAGILTPEKEQEIKLGEMDLAQLKASPEFKERQMNALNIIMEQAKGGWTPQLKADLRKELQTVEQESQAKQAQITQEMQQRGMGGAGAELASRLSGAQAATSRLSESGDRLAGIAAQNVLSAAAQGGQLSSQMSEQDFAQRAAAAQSADQARIAQFNADTSLQTRNVAAMNAAQQANIARQQQVSDANVAAQNQEYQRQRQAQQAMYEMELQKAQAKNAALAGLSQGYAGNAAATQQGWANIGSGFSSLGGSIGQGLASAKK